MTPHEVEPKIERERGRMSAYCPICDVFGYATFSVGAVATPKGMEMALGALLRTFKKFGPHQFKRPEAQ